MINYILVALTIFLLGCSVNKIDNKMDELKPIAKDQNSTSTSPYPVKVAQNDGTSIDIIGKGNMYSSYTETTDGYTIMRNKEGIYEYAVRERNGKLVPGGTKANNLKNRSKKDIRFLKSIDKHLRNL